MDKTKRLDIWVGGSDTPFTFDVTDMEFVCAVKSMENGQNFNFYLSSPCSEKKSFVLFNASRVDAMKLTED